MTKEKWHLIFDMDGTLVNSAAVSVMGCQRVARRLSLPVPAAVTVASFIGYADEEFYGRLYPALSKEERAVFAAMVEQVENAAMAGMGGALLYDGVMALLERLAKEGYYLAIASTGTKGHVEAALSAAGIAGFFQKVSCGAPDKTDMVGEILQNGPAGRWLMLGDRHKDSEAGRANGIVTVAARYGCGNKAEYSQFDYGIDEPRALIKLLAAL